MASGVAESAAVDALNVGPVLCTQATKIGYVVRDVTVDVEGFRGVWTYRATLVAVIVGEARRPVEPAVAVYFYRPVGDPVADAGQRL
jgi:hypothetical protein